MKPIKICSVDGCSRPFHAREWCLAHYSRWRRHGNLREADQVVPLLGAKERFWSKVDKSGSCWEWTAYKDRHGYGQFHFDGRAVLSHRHSWEQHNGPIPDGLVIDHACHNPSCVNPDHLRLATVKQNAENLLGATMASKSRVRGVSWHQQQKKWVASLGHHGKWIYVGLFDDISEAEKAIVAKRNELYTHNLSDRPA